MIDYASTASSAVIGGGSEGLLWCAPRVSVIIVNFNAGPLLSTCVKSVLASPVELEVIVSDNGSTDDSLALLQEFCGTDQRLTIIENCENLGFARANNVALGAARGRYLLFLNPDCVVPPPTLNRMLQFMDATLDAGMSGCIVRDPSGREQVASRRVIPDPWIGMVRLLHLERALPSLLLSKRVEPRAQPLPEAPVQVEAISGALMFVRRAALEQVGQLDEGYFLHCEDLDWFVRFGKAGWQIYLIPDIDAVHYKGACSVGRPLFVLWHKHLGMTRFFRKFQFCKYPLPLSLLVILGIWVHFAVVVSIAWIRKQVQRLRS